MADLLGGGDLGSDNPHVRDYVPAVHRAVPHDGVSASARVGDRSADVRASLADVSAMLFAAAVGLPLGMLLTRRRGWAGR